MLRRIACIHGVAVLAVLLAACGRSERVEESKIVGDTLTVYSSLPQTGPLASVARDVLRAEKLAIEEAGGKVGDFKISFVSLDSSDPKTGRWTARRVAANAREAVDDLQTIAYLGELEAGASAVSLPILNEGGMLQVSPGDPYAGLTERVGAGEPEKYYPSGRRTFTRMIESDTQEVDQLADLLERRGARRVSVADDRQVAGTAFADRLGDRLLDRGIEVVDRERLNPNGEVPDDICRDAREDEADAFVYTGAYAPFAMGVLRTVHAGAPRVDLFGTDGLAIGAELGVRAGPAADRLVVTAVAPEKTDSSRAFGRSFRERYGRAPDRRAVLGYHAMRLVLGAIERAGADAASRPEVIREAVRTAGFSPAGFAPYRLDGGVLVPIRSDQ